MPTPNQHQPIAINHERRKKKQTFSYNSIFQAYKSIMVIDSVPFDKHLLYLYPAQHSPISTDLYKAKEGEAIPRSIKCDAHVNKQAWPWSKDKGRERDRERKRESCLWFCWNNQPQTSLFWHFPLVIQNFSQHLQPPSGLCWMDGESGTVTPNLKLSSTINQKNHHGVKQNGFIISQNRV